MDGWMDKVILWSSSALTSINIRLILCMLVFFISIFLCANSSYHMVFVFSLQLKNIWLDLQQSVHFLVPWCLYISFFQTNQLGVYTLTTSPSPPSTKEHNTSQATFPLPHPSLSPSPFLLQAAHSIIPTSLLSLSPFQWMYNPPFNQACPGGVGFRGHTHPHHICRRTNAHHRE